MDSWVAIDFETASVRAAMRAVLEAIIETGRRLDVLVNNAGYSLTGGVEQVEVDRARACFETSFFGTLGLFQEVLPAMRRQGEGLIVNVSTVFAAALCPSGLGYYIASKAALETALAVEAAPGGMRVNFQPGPVMTGLSREWGQRLPASEDPRPTMSDELYEWVLGDHRPLSCPAKSPGEVAAALCEVIGSGGPHLACQSGAAAEAHVAEALRDVGRDRELARLRSTFAQTLAWTNSDLRHRAR